MFTAALALTWVTNLCGVRQSVTLLLGVCHSRALTPFHVTDDSLVTDKKFWMAFKERKGEKCIENSTSLQKERLIICNNGSPIALREKITGKKGRSEISFYWQKHIHCRQKSCLLGKMASIRSGWQN